MNEEIKEIMNKTKGTLSEKDKKCALGKEIADMQYELQGKYPGLWFDEYEAKGAVLSEEDDEEYTKKLKDYFS